MCVLQRVNDDRVSVMKYAKFTLISILFHFFIHTLNAVIFDHYADGQYGVRILSWAPTNGHCLVSNHNP